MQKLTVPNRIKKNNAHITIIARKHQNNCGLQNSVFKMFKYAILCFL